MLTKFFTKVALAKGKKKAEFYFLFINIDINSIIKNKKKKDELKNF